MTPPQPGRIGPNAVLQLTPVLETTIGAAATRSLLDRAGIGPIDPGAGLIDEAPVAQLHRLVREQVPDPQIVMGQAGAATADYVLAHRIPKPAQIILRALPAPLAAPILARAITQHAWTFAGSGGFRAITPWRFELVDNPLIRGEEADQPLCIWHAAVFARLYSVLVRPGTTCRETACTAMGAPACRFDLS